MGTFLPPPPRQIPTIQKKTNEIHRDGGTSFADFKSTFLIDRKSNRKTDVLISIVCFIIGFLIGLTV